MLGIDDYFFFSATKANFNDNDTKREKILVNIDNADIYGEIQKYDRKIQFIIS